MVPRPAGRALSHWMFLAIGVLCVTLPEFVVHTVLHADDWTRLLARRHHSLPFPLLTAAHYYLVPVALLCIAAAIGLMRRKSWARGVGCAAACLLLAGFPAFTVFGAIGLYALFAKPARKRPRPSANPSSRGEQGGEEREPPITAPFLAGLSMFCAFLGFAILCLYAQRYGFPAWNAGALGWFCLVVCLLVHALLHELGHAAIAWTLFFRVRTIDIGPMQIRSDGDAWRFRFDWKLAWDHSAYNRAIASSDDHLLLKQIAILAAGPAISLISGGLLLMAFFALPGSGWERWWWLVAGNAVLGIMDAVVNLLPAGRSDGWMLYHLLKGGAEGDQILHSAKLAMVWEQAAACRGSADFEQEVELRRQVLELAAGSRMNGATLAQARLALGYALLGCEDWIAAERELRQSVDLSTDSEERTTAWAGIRKACLERGNFAEAAESRNESKAPVRGNRKRREPKNQPPMLRAAALSAQAQSLLADGLMDEGLAQARQAAGILGSREVPAARRNLALVGIADIGDTLWKFGESALAVELLREAANALESRGAALAGARCRLKLSRVLRSIGRHAEAIYMLPDEENLPAVARRALLAERGELHLAGGRIAEAVAEFERLSTLWRAQPEAPAIEIAVAESLLARALLESGDSSRAGRLARSATEALSAVDHPDAASCRITLALAGRERSRAVFDAALRSLEASPLLARGEKARRLECERTRIARMGPIEGAAVWETAVAI